jgi:protein regulator of cytokinesis 1
MDLLQTLADVHPSLVDSSTTGQTKSISNVTLDRLAQTIRSLQEEKRVRLRKVMWLHPVLLLHWNFRMSKTMNAWSQV